MDGRNPALSESPGICDSRGNATNLCFSMVSMWWHHFSHHHGKPIVFGIRRGDRIIPGIMWCRNLSIRRRNISSYQRLGGRLRQELRQSPAKAAASFWTTSKLGIDGVTPQAERGIPNEEEKHMLLQAPPFWWFRVHLRETSSMFVCFLGILHSKSPMGTHRIPCLLASLVPNWMNSLWF